MPWTETFIEKYENKWSWVDFTGFNWSIPWSLDFIEKHWDKCDYEFWVGAGVDWEKLFKPYLTDEVVGEVMSKISKVK